MLRRFLETNEYNRVFSFTENCSQVSCGWTGKASVTNPVQTCEIDGITPASVNTASVCNNGTASTCNNQQPWSVHDSFAYGFSSANIYVCSLFYFSHDLSLFN
jgi:hypothetical protein